MGVFLYSDGASEGNPGPGGFGTILVFRDANDEEQRVELSKGYKYTTNNRMEIRGVLEGLKYIAKHLPNERTVHIYTDSQYVVKTFEEKWIYTWIKNDWKRPPNYNRVKNEDLWKAMIIRMLSDHLDCYFHWVKGHDECEENNICDRLAVEAAHLPESELKADRVYMKSLSPDEE